MNEYGTLTRQLEGLSVGIVGEDQQVPEPVPLWRDGLRLRRRERGTAVAVLLVAAALVAVGTLPVGGRPSTLPATGPDGLPTSFPARVAMPADPVRTAAPGVTALALPAERDGRRVVWTVGPTGAVHELVADSSMLDGGVPGVSQEVSLSPDGRRLAGSGAVQDLVSGRVTDVDLATTVPLTEIGSVGRPWWSPDSRRVYLPREATTPPSAGVVLDADSGAVSVVPAPEGGPSVVQAGWRDASTLVAVWQTGPDTRQVHTWTVGDEAWREGPSITWPGPTTDTESSAAVSPDGRSIVLLDLGVDDTSGPRTRARVFDLATGSPEGSAADWAGWGCRPVWRAGRPVVTDDLAFRPVGGDGGPLVRVSSELGTDGCPAAAGDSLRGSPAEDSALVWAERARTWGGLLGVLLALGVVVWWSGRRRGWKRPVGRLPFVYQVGGR